MGVTASATAPAEACTKYVTAQDAAESAASGNFSATSHAQEQPCGPPWNRGGSPIFRVAAGDSWGRAAGPRAKGSTCGEIRDTEPEVLRKGQ